MRTPAMTDSSTEFHPWCVKKQTTSCSTTSHCSAHDVTTGPEPLVRRGKPYGRRASRSDSRDSSDFFIGSSLGGLRTTHKNVWLLASRPMAISLIYLTLNRPSLPKETNTTLAFGCVSSHARDSWPRSTTTSSDLTSGPMQ